MKLALWKGKPEIFYSIQGEGVSLGQPSIFVRLSLCNLHCIWCDTDYTWNWEGTQFEHRRDQEAEYQKFRKEEQLIECDTEAVVEMVRSFPGRRLVLTGGEPMIQQEALVDLMQTLRAIDPSYWFEVETNGTLMPEIAFDALVDQYNVSPKLENSGNPLRLRERANVYTYFAGSSKAFFKFVVAEREDLEEVLAIIERYQIQRDRVLLMPEGTNPESLKARQSWLIETCKEHEFRYTDRLHIHIYGEKRGV